MKLFECQSCRQLLNFQNTRCERCGHQLGYLPDRFLLSALEPLEEGRWKPLADPARTVRFCANEQHGVCNWLIRHDSPELYCPACRLNRTIPNLDNAAHVQQWQQLEFAKHRLIYGLMRLGVPIQNRRDDPVRGLAFDFVDPNDAPPETIVSTGHRRGLVTIDISEADDVERERYRASLGEPYRTVLGHFRHEVGHYYWELLVQDTAWLPKFRELFGDERADYSEALRRNYIEGAPSGWDDQFISKYAASHPWEDWAEVWAHYFHILDTVETAHAYGLTLSPGIGNVDLSVMQNLDPYAPIGLDTLLSRWFPLFFAGNALNRSMGQPDLYPFILRPAVIGKLRFVHEVARGARFGAPPQPLLRTT